LQELRLACFFPADTSTEQHIKALAGVRRIISMSCCQDAAALL
jgi:hypothetical protein